MPGNIQFRPVEANLTHDTDWLGKMDPYCKFTLGTSQVKSSVCRHGGTRPHWGDIVSLPTTGLTGTTPNVVRLEVFDKDKFRPDDHIAYTDIDLSEIEQRGTVSKWYPLYHRRKPAGEILIEAAIQQPVQQVFVQQVIPTTTYVQETVLSSAPVETIVGESYVVNEVITQGATLQSGVPLNEGVLLNQSVPLNQGLIGSTTLTSYTTTTVDPNLALYSNNAGLTNAGLVGTNPGLASKVSALGPSGGLPHGNRALKGLTNAGYSERPGYTLGDTEANPTCQSNLDSNGGGLFNKPGRERRVEPYSLSNPGTYGIPHGQTIDTSGHLRPDVALQRQAPIGTINHPGITGYPDGYTTPQQALAQQGLYGTGLNTGYAQSGLPGSYSTGLNTITQPGLQQGSYNTGLTSVSQGLPQGSYGTGLNTGYAQPGLQSGSYTTGLGQQGLGLNQGLGGQQILSGQQGLGLNQGLSGQQGLGLNQGLSTQQGVGLNQQGLSGQQNLNAGLGNQTYGQY